VLDAKFAQAQRDGLSSCSTAERLVAINNKTDDPLSALAQIGLPSIGNKLFRSIVVDIKRPVDRQPERPGNAPLGRGWLLRAVGVEEFGPLEVTSCL